jgi:hypothetical protein
LDPATVLAIGTVATGLLTGGGGLLVSLRNRRSADDDETERERDKLRLEARELRRENVSLWAWVGTLLKAIRDQGGDAPNPPDGLQ